MSIYLHKEIKLILALTPRMCVLLVLKLCTVYILINSGHRALNPLGTKQGRDATRPLLAILYREQNWSHFTYCLVTFYAHAITFDMAR